MLPRRLVSAEGTAGGFDVPLRLLEGVLGLSGRAIGYLLDDANGSLPEFCIGGIEVDHEVAGDFSTAHHGQRAEQVQDQFCGGAGFQASGAGQNLGSEDRIDDEGRLERRGNFQVWIKADENELGAGLLRGLKGAPNKGSSSAGGDSDDEIASGDAAELERAHSCWRVIFGAFDAAPEGIATAGDDALELIRVRAEGGRAFAGIQNAQSPAGACADVKDASVGAKGANDESNCASDSPSLREQGAWDAMFFGEHQFDGVIEIDLIEPQ